MIQRLRAFGIVFIAVALVACAAPQKASLTAEVRKSIKRIALVEAPEPTEYQMNPGTASGGALHVLGPLGSNLLGSISARRIEAASTRFTAEMLPYKPGISAVLLAQLETGLKQKGYEVVRVPPLPRTVEGIGFDFTKIQGSFDAVLTSTLHGGYSVEFSGAGPRLVASIALVTHPRSERLFSNTYVYGSRTFGDWVQVMPDPRFVAGSVEAVHADMKLASEGLQTAAAKLAQRIVADL